MSITAVREKNMSITARQKSHCAFVSNDGERAHQMVVSFY